MAVYIITGKLGAGKSLTAISMMQRYINQGRRIATNMDIYPEHFSNKNNRHVSITRVPDKPRVENLNALGMGYDGDYRGEDHNGLLLLDEGGTWLNSRGWADKSRAPVIEWFLHARKYRWDMAIIIQNIEMMDKQARVSLAEHTVWMRRFDRFRIPLLGRLTKLMGYEVRPPKIHTAVIKYGDTQQHPTVDRWNYIGTSLYPLYNTEQAFVDSEGGNYSLLSPWHLVGRYQQEKTWQDHANKYLMPIIRLILTPYCLLSEALPPPRQRGRQCVGHQSRLRSC
jgi:hypothetical protein